MTLKQITTGQDSFLDIVANLVGILIILVVVVGAQASASWVKSKPDSEKIDKIAELEAELSTSSYVYNKLQADNEQLDERVIRENQFAAALTDQRHQMLMQMAVVKGEIKKQRAQLQQQTADLDDTIRENIRRQYDFLSRKRQLESELAAIKRETNAVAANESKSEEIKHFPNPIAKTVFSEEVHFRLSKGKIAHVPMDELIARMKTEWKVKAEKLKEASRTLETVGPIGSFRMQYELVAEDVRRKTKVGTVSQKAVRFKQFQLLPTSGSFGEPIETALQPGSQFLRILARHEPRKTTVSIWVYPESFDEHEKLKVWLHGNGFQMASWPLNFGKRISGGPNGFKTSAQ